MGILQTLIFFVSRGEAAKLHLVDVDLRSAVLTVYRSKGRSRILAIRDDLVVELRQYLPQREEVLAASGADDPLTLFIRRDGSALTVLAASEALRCLLRDLGLKPPRGRSGSTTIPKCSQPNDCCNLEAVSGPIHPTRP